MQSSEKPQISCYVCLKPIDEESDEHIIPNSIGGKLKAKLLCKEHNNKFGATVEGIFAKKMNPFCNLLNIKRGRNSIPDQPVIYLETNRVAYMKADGGLESKDFNHEVVKNGNQVDLHIHAPDDDARKTRKNLTGLKRKYPNLDVEEVMSRLAKDTAQGNHKVRLDIDLSGIEIQQVTCKTAINLYLHFGGERNYISHLISPLEKGEAVPVHLICPEKSFFEHSSESFLHSLLLIGSPEDKLLYCLVEYFNTVSFVVVLNSDYDGPVCKKAYFFDPVKGEEVDIGFRVPRASELDKLARDRGGALETTKERIKYFMDRTFEQKNELQKRKPSPA